MSRFRINSGRVVYLPNIIDKKVTEFPGSWFSANPNAKPTLIVPKCSDRAVLRNKIRKAVDGASVHIDYVVSYLYHTLKEESAVLDSDWISYNIRLGSKDEVCSLFSMVNVKEVDECTEDSEAGQADQTDDKWLVMWILAVYRLCKEKNPNYRQTLIKTIENHVKAMGCKVTPGFQLGLVYNQGWICSMEYRKIIACVDSFYFRFDTLEWSDLRIATSGSRFRDCGGLLALMHVSEILRLNNCIDIMSWISDNTLARELESMLMNKEETDNPHSYFPYQADLGLVTRSPYSARANPAVYAFCHIIGTIFSNVRSQNANFFLESSVRGVIFNAQWVAYAFSKNILSDKNSGSVEQNLQQKPQSVAGVESEKALMLAEEEPNTLNPQLWFNYMKLQNWKLTEPMLQMISRVQHNIINPRPGTMAELINKSVFLGPQ